MDNLIYELYKKNIIQIKNVGLKNGINVPFYIDLYKIFDHKHVLNCFVDLLNELIIDKNISNDYIFGINDVCKNLSTLLGYKYNYNNIIESNLRNIKLDNEIENNIENLSNNEIHHKSCIILKNNFGISSKTNKIIKNLKKFNLQVDYVISLLNYNTDIDASNNYYLLDYYQILNTLYLKKCIDYEKYLGFYVKMCNNSYINFNDRIKQKNINIKGLATKIINKKSNIIFCCSLIQKLGFKDLIKTIDFVGKHVSIIKIDNMNNYNELEIKSLIKLADHHKFKILSTMDISDDSHIKLVTIENFLKYDYVLQNVETIIYDNVIINDFSNIRSNIYRKLKQIDKILGIITINNIYMQENKLKIFDIKEFEDNILEDKIIKYNYDMLIVNNINNLVSIKQLCWNIYEKNKV